MTHLVECEMPVPAGVNPIERLVHERRPPLVHAAPQLVQECPKIHHSRTSHLRSILQSISEGAFAATYSLMGVF